MKVWKILLNLQFVIMFIVYVEGDVKTRDYCHIIGKYRGSAYKGCNMNVKLNHKISTVLHNLQNCDSHLILRELD